MSKSALVILHTVTLTPTPKGSGPKTKRDIGILIIHRGSGNAK